MGVEAYLPAATPRNLLLGAGAVYFNYGELTEALIGATRGGSTFTVERDIRQIEQDGTFGPVKGLRRKTRVVPILKVNAMELSITTLPKYYGGMTVDQTNVNYDKVTEDIELVDADYLTNITFIGETQDGQNVIIIVKNALGDGALELAIEDKNEAVPEVQFTGHYLDSALRTVPYEIRFPKDNVSDTTAPTVTCVPDDAATGILVGANVVMTFSEAIASGAINTDNFTLMKASDGAIIAGALTYNSSQTIVTFNPTSDLSGATAYIMTIGTGVTDVKGNKLAATNVFNFTTA